MTRTNKDAEPSTYTKVTLMLETADAEAVDNVASRLSATDPFARPLTRSDIIRRAVRELLDRLK